MSEASTVTNLDLVGKAPPKKGAKPKDDGITRHEELAWVQFTGEGIRLGGGIHKVPAIVADETTKLFIGTWHDTLIVAVDSNEGLTRIPFAMCVVGPK